MRLQPFRAVRPAPEMAADVAAVPYDVVSRAEAAELARGNPRSFLHVGRSDIDLPEDVDPHDSRVYTGAREALDRLMREGVLAQDDEPSLFVYRLIMDGHVQTGLVGCVHVDDYDNNVILKHEKTRPDKEDDRTRHVLTLNAHAEPVILTYRGRPEIDRLTDQVTRQDPVYDFTAPDGVRHTVWRVMDTHPWAQYFGTIPVCYVADGHHRCASASRAARERREANPSHHGAEEYNWFLAVLFPSDQLQILPYNRLVRDLGGQTPAEVLERLAEVGELSETDRPEPPGPASVCVYLDGKWYRLTFDLASIDMDDVTGSLDVSLLQERVLTPILGVGDPRTDPRIEFVGGIRGSAELERKVRSGEHAIGFSMHPTSLAQLLAVSDAGEVMPPKSTWFEPKLRSGLFVHMIE